MLLSVKPDNQLNKLEISVLNGFIITSLKDLSINEIKHAFRLALAGTLDVKMYQRLDSKIMGAVASSYRIYSANKLRTIPKKIEVKEVDKQEIEKEFKELCVIPYLEVREKINKPIISVECYHIFKYLYKHKHIKLEAGEVEYYKELSKGIWQTEIKQKRSKGERISINTPMPTNRSNIISACIALYEKSPSIKIGLLKNKQNDDLL